MADESAPDIAPMTCIYCKDEIPIGDPCTLISKTETDENGEPDFDTMQFVAAAHNGCWERGRPDAD